MLTRVHMAPYRITGILLLSLGLVTGMAAPGADAEPRAVDLPGIVVEPGPGIPSWIHLPDHPIVCMGDDSPGFSHIADCLTTICDGIISEMPYANCQFKLYVCTNPNSSPPAQLSTQPCRTSQQEVLRLPW